MRSLRSFRIVVLTILLSTAPDSLAAQSVSGRVLLPDSATAVVGATLIVRDSSGTTIAQAISGNAGRYSLQLPRSGRFEVQAIRIGYRPVRLPLVALAAAEVRQLDIIMTEQPLELAEIGVTARDQCRMSRGERDRFLELWQRARSTLGAHVSRGSGNLDIHVLEVGGTEDGPVTIPNGTMVWDPDRRSTERDSLQAREVWTEQFVARTPAEVLAALGYARYDPDGGVVYDVPNPEAVLSDNFLSRYCFKVERGPEGHRDWVGLRFEPMAEVDSLTDVSGTLWIDGATAELRRLDFEYHNLPRIPFPVCRSSNRPLLTTGRELQRTPDYWRIGPYCLARVAGLMVPRPPEGTGGTLDFSIVGAGEWVLSHWTLRTPGTEFMDRRARFNWRPTNQGLEVCYDRERMCRPVLVGVPRLLLTSGAIGMLRRNGVELYRDDRAIAALTRVASMQAGSRAGHIEGVVADEAGRPVSRAVVTTEVPARAAITDESGRFEIRTLPARVLSFQVRSSGHRPLAFNLPIIVDSTRRVNVALEPQRP